MKHTNLGMKFLLPILAAACIVNLRAATVTLDIGTKHQVVDGFGGTSDRIVPWRVRSGPFYITVDLEEVGFYDSVGQDMSVYRTYIPPFQASEGAPYQDLDLTIETKLHQYGIDRFFACSFSPPGWMKDNNDVTQGGALLPQYYDDFANLCAEYCRQFKQKVGVDVYAVSLQNEPRFVEPYASCVYNGGTYRDLSVVAAPILKAVAPNVKLLGPEDVLQAAGTSNSWVNMILNSSAASTFGVYAVHCHTQIFENTSDPYNGWWNNVQNTADPNNLPIWMTETGDNFDTNWTTAPRLAATVANSFKHGNCAAWVWLTVADISYAVNSMIRDGFYSPKYYQLAHFGRFVKLNARRIESSSDDAQLIEVAFENTDGSVAVIVVNTRSSAKTVSLAGAGLPGQFHAYQSSSKTSMMQDMGVVATGNALAIPANSITTLTSGTTHSVRRPTPSPAVVKAVCRQAATGAAVVVEPAVRSHVALSVFSPNGELVAQTGAVVGAETTTLTWGSDVASPPLAAGMYIGRVRIVSVDGAKASEHVLRLQPR